jgi:superfamily II DNA/RNA helicase
VLDEADRLFSKEYREELLSLVKQLPRNCVNVLASATISSSTRRLAAGFMKDPSALDLLDEGVLSRDIEHWVFYVDHRKRLDFLRRLEAAVHPERCLVFASTGERVARAAERLDALGLPVDAILARQEKEHRRVALERFEKGILRYLVTTDLAARGLDIGKISHVISLDFPEDSSWYIHRAGRTGRAGEKGISILLADGYELRGASKIAVERNFVFRTKMLDSGQAVEPPVEEFFDMVEREEEEKRQYRARRTGQDRRPGK